MKELKNKVLTNAFFKYLSGSYGLQLVIEFNDGEHLYFDSVKFSLEKKTALDDFIQIKNYDYLIGEYIESIRQDEITNYFIEFSNKTILYIYQRIYSSESWEQDFMLVTERDIDYIDIKNHMEEDWLFSSFS
jgi:hypothetical protein